MHNKIALIEDAIGPSGDARDETARPGFAPFPPFPSGTRLTLLATVPPLAFCSGFATLAFLSWFAPRPVGAIAARLTGVAAWSRLPPLAPFAGRPWFPPDAIGAIAADFAGVASRACLAPLAPFARPSGCPWFPTRTGGARLAVFQIIEPLHDLGEDSMLRLDKIGAQIGNRLPALRLKHFHFARPFAAQLRYRDGSGVKKRVR
jgi:hypothetical protein